MAISNCYNPVDSRGRELVDHGTVEFPIACYHDDWTKDVLPWHWHDELEFAVMTEGSAIVAAGSEKFAVREGDGFFINSGILHSCWNAGTGICRFHSLVFHPRLVGGSMDSIFYQRYILPFQKTGSPESLRLSSDIPWQNAVLDSIERAWQQCAAENEGYEFLVREHLSRAVFHLWQNLPPVPVSTVHSLRNAERIKRMLSYIHENFSQEINASQIAATVSISESECLRCFRSSIGTSPIQYLKQYRIRRALQRLEETEDRISEIAVQCGFQDISYFTKSFREQTGFTPSQYRKNRRS